MSASVASSAAPALGNSLPAEAPAPAATTTPPAPRPSSWATPLVIPRPAAAATAPAAAGSNNNNARGAQPASASTQGGEQPQQQQQQQQPAAPTMTFPQVRAGRVHHNMPQDELQVHSYQLQLAQQIASHAFNVNSDPVTYQAQLAAQYGIDPALLPVLYTMNGPRRLDGTELPLGLMLIRDDNVYAHIELVSRYPHLASINNTVVDLDPHHAAFFLVTCPERLVHESVKYGTWTIPASGAAGINKAFAQMVGIGPVYILFASTDSLTFSGIAEILGPTVPVAPAAKAAAAATATTTEEAKKPEEEVEGAEPAAAAPPAIDYHRIPLRWVFCKNIPFNHMHHVSLRPASREAEEARRLHGGLQPMTLADGTRALQLIARHPLGGSVLLDFKYYDDAEARGIIAESGDASVRAAIRFQLHMRGNYQMRDGRPQQGFRGRGGYAQQQQSGQRRPFNHQNPRGAYVAGAAGAPAAGGPAAATAAPKQAAAEGAGAVSAAPAREQGSRGGRGGRGASRGGGSSGGNNHAAVAAPVRQVEGVDGERVALPTKFNFEPRRKEKQQQHRNKKGAKPSAIEEADDEKAPQLVGIPPEPVRPKRDDSDETGDE